MICKTCGNDLHIDAEACWRCGTFTARGQEKEQARQEDESREAERQSKLQEIDDKLRAEYQRQANSDSDTIDITWGNQDSWLSWEESGETHNQSTTPPSRRIQMIRKLRVFVGEEPEPVVFPSSARRILAELLFVGIMWGLMCGLLIWILMTFSNFPAKLEKGVPFLLFMLAFIPLYMVFRLLGVRKFGKLKRELRQRRNKEIARHSEAK